MDARNASELPASLRRARQQMTLSGGVRLMNWDAIPEKLWRLAAQLAVTHGVKPYREYAEA